MAPRPRPQASSRAWPLVGKRCSKGAKIGGGPCSPTGAIPPSAYRPSQCRRSSSLTTPKIGNPRSAGWRKPPVRHTATAVGHTSRVEPAVSTWGPEPLTTSWPRCRSCSSISRAAGGGARCRLRRQRNPGRQPARGACRRRRLRQQSPAPGSRRACRGRRRAPRRTPQRGRDVGRRCRPRPASA